MLDRLAGLVLRKPKSVLVLVLLFVLAGGAVSQTMTKRLTMGGYSDENSESHHAAQVLAQTFKQGEPNFMLLVTDRRGIDDPAVAAAGTALTQRLQREAGLQSVASYWTAGKPAALRNKDGNRALVMGTIAGDFDTMLERVKELAPAYEGRFQGLEVKAGGSALMWHENTETATKDVTRADSIVFPVLLVVLILIFGSLVAAALPLVVAFATMLMTMLALWGLTFFVDSSFFVINVTTFLGLGLAVDYSLLIVSRYREELRKGLDLPEAIRVTLRTAGRTVVFSAVIVAIALSVVLVLPFTIFTSLASSAIVTALLCALSSLIVVPALLVMLGHRIDKLRLIKRKDAPAGTTENGFWHRLALFVMRRPIPVALLVLAFVMVLGLPAKDLKLRLPDEQVLPKSAHAAQTAQILRAEFNTQEQQVIQVVARGVGDPAARGAEIADYAGRLSALPNVARVDALTGSYVKGRVAASPDLTNYRFRGPDATFLNVVPAVDGLSKAGEDLVRDVRAERSPFSNMLVGGAPAVSADTFEKLYDRLPLALGLLALGMYVLLFLLTGSVLLPIIAMVLTMLSLSATFGALVFIFQDGNLLWLVGDVIVTGAITWTVPIMLFALAFGLSMDYQVFMLARFREEYDATGDNTTAVATGLERTGRVVTYAAVCISLVFLAWITSGLSYTKAVGIGLPLAILMDATLIRGAMLPAFMKLAGRANWWAPGPLRRIHARFGVSEGGEDAAGDPRAKEEPVPAR
ncbi:MMPL family transporter [Actinomadura viridis]|uniref:MMPL family transporter n=1 Tax=Actinomadura viridis TaxID=58110 RepID=UPI00367698BF